MYPSYFSTSLNILKKLARTKATTPLPTKKTDRRRISELHIVIRILINAFPDESSSFLWNELKRDVAKTKRIYDSGELIQHISSTQINWTSSRGVEQRLKKSSFQTLVSRLKHDLLVSTDKNL